MYGWGIGVGAGAGAYCASNDRAIYTRRVRVSRGLYSADAGDLG